MSRSDFDPPSPETATPAAERRALGESAARGGVLTVGAQLLRTCITIAGTAYVARQLTPADYGLVAIVAVLVGAGEILRDFGLSIAAVQAPRLDQAEKSNLFWLNLAIGGLFGIVLLLAARPLARAFGRPDLIGIAEALSIIFILNGAAAQFRADLVRGLRFRALAGANIFGALVGTIAAVVLAGSGAGYWALVWGLIITAAASLGYVAIVAHWRPSPFSRDADMRDLLRFGGSNALVQLLNYGSKSIAPFTIGLFGGPSGSGLYDRSSQAVLVPLNQINAPATDVALPVLSRVQSDRATFLDFVKRGQAALVASAGLAVCVLFVYAPELVRVLLGDQWGAAVPIVRLLAAGALLETLGFVVYWVFIARGLGGALLRYSLVGRPIIITLTVLGSVHGATGAAAGYLVGQCLLWPLSLWWAARAAKLDLTVLMRNGLLWLVTLGAAVGSAMLLSSALGQWGMLVSVTASAAGFILGAALTYAAIPHVRDEFRDMVVLYRAIRRG